MVDLKEAKYFCCDKQLMIKENIQMTNHNQSILFCNKCKREYIEVLAVWK